MDGEPILRCPRRLIKEEPPLAIDLFWYYRRYDKGLLSEDGGLQSQPHKLMTAMRIMEAAFSTVDEEDRKKRDRQRTVDESRWATRDPKAHRVAPGGGRR